MSNCDIFFNKGCKGKVYSRSDALDMMDPCVCPPIGEPEKLTLVAPVIFDECGINLCKVGQRDIALNYPDAAAAEVSIADIDFNVNCKDGSKVEFIKDRPNCCRITLSNICVKFTVKVLDENNQIMDTFCIDELYLPPEDDPEWDEETNPSAVAVELYAPYGVSYIDTCDEFIPTINCLGFIEKGKGLGNNGLRQGINTQAMAKIVRADMERGIIAMGLTLYLKVMYFVQYNMPHLGLCVPPKVEPHEVIPENSCKDFCEGDLLELNVCPLPLFPEDDDCDDDFELDCEVCNVGNGEVKEIRNDEEVEEGPRPRKRGF